MTPKKTPGRRISYEPIEARIAYALYYGINEAFTAAEIAKFAKRGASNIVAMANAHKATLTKEDPAA